MLAGKRPYFESAGPGPITTAPDFEETMEKMWRKEQTTSRLEWAREVNVEALLSTWELLGAA